MDLLRLLEMFKKETKKKMKKLKIADVIQVIGISVALFFSIWGIRLTNKIIDTSIDINHFDTLLTHIAAIQT